MAEQNDARGLRRALAILLAAAALATATSLFAWWLPGAGPAGWQWLRALRDALGATAWCAGVAWLAGSLLLPGGLARWRPDREDLASVGRWVALPPAVIIAFATVNGDALLVAPAIVAVQLALLRHVARLVENRWAELLCGVGAMGAVLLAIIAGTLLLPQPTLYHRLSALTVVVAVLAITTVALFRLQRLVHSGPAPLALPTRPQADDD